MFKHKVYVYKNNCTQLYKIDVMPLYISVVNFQPHCVMGFAVRGVSEPYFNGKANRDIYELNIQRSNKDHHYYKLGSIKCITTLS